MTSIISLKKVRCKNCHKCIRSCPVNSIMYKDDQAQIMPEQCILCGHCINTCPQNAKTVLSDIFKIRGYLKAHAVTVLSIAPSFSGLLRRPSLLPAILKKLGFTYVHETSEGAALVSLEYQRLLELGTMDNIITTCCPTVNMLLEKYYPDLIPQMAPVVSPMIAHAKLLREKYGPNAKIIFVGPCISKKEEARDPRNAGLVDAVLTFEELIHWITEEGIDQTDLEEVPFDNDSPASARMYPITSGIVTTIMAQKGFYGYKTLCVDDIENCKALFQDIRHGEVHGCFIEVNSCPGGCINGPVSGHEGSRFSARLAVEAYTGSEQTTFPQIQRDSDLQAQFRDASQKEDMPTEEELKQILHHIGKETREAELNCGACGYSTCREKAISIFQGKSEPTMCLPYMKERAESVSNNVLDATPNAIIAVDDTLTIQQFNRAAYSLYGIDPGVDMTGHSADEVYDVAELAEVVDSRKNILSERCFLDSLGIYVEKSIVYDKEHRLLLIFLKDINKEEQEAKRAAAMRRDTIEITDQVISKQMRVVQEIASLLGETTAETKIALTKLKNSMAD